MASIFNIAQHSKKDPNAEETLLAMWEAREKQTKTQALCVRWNNDGSLLAAGGGDGVVRFFQVRGGHHLEKRNIGSSVESVNPIFTNDRMPVMGLRFRPGNTATHLRVAYADNMVELYDYKTGSSKASTKEVDTETMKENQILAIDYNVDGTMWASAGKDRVVRVYDETQPKGPKKELAGTRCAPGHSNRICCVRFSTHTPSLIASAGLDGTVKLWDVRDRTPEPLLTIGDVEIAGDALDFHVNGNELLAGSWRPMNQVQVYDLRTGTLVYDVPWKKKPPAGSVVNKSRWGQVRDAVVGSCNVYGASFITNGKCQGGIVAGGTGSKEVKVFVQPRHDSSGPPEPKGNYRVPSGVHGVHLNPYAHHATATMIAMPVAALPPAFLPACLSHARPDQDC